MQLKLLLFIPVIIIQIGCQQADSSDIATNAMFADFTVVTGNQATSDIEAELKVGGQFSNIFVHLSNGDTLLASAGGQTQVMREQTDLFGKVWYTATFNVGDQEGILFNITFDRNDGVDAPNSNVTLPSPFVFDQPIADDTFSWQTDTMTVSWTPGLAGDRDEFRFAGVCVVPDPDSGTVRRTISTTISLAGDQGNTSIFLPNLIPPNSICGANNFEIKIERMRNGSVDPAYGEGGRFKATQKRNLNVNLVP